MKDFAITFGSMFFAQILAIIVMRIGWKREDRKAEASDTAAHEQTCDALYRAMSDCAVRWETARQNALIEIRCATDSGAEQSRKRRAGMSEPLDCYLSSLEAFRGKVNDEIMDVLIRDLTGHARALHGEIYEFACNWRQQTPDFELRSEKHDASLMEVRARFDQVRKERQVPKGQGCGTLEASPASVDRLHDHPQGALGNQRACCGRGVDVSRNRSSSYKSC